MEVINDIIRQIDKHAAKQYKVFAGRTSGHLESRKDFILFDLIRKDNGEIDETKLINKLYGKEDRNAYYRLKNRLAEDIGLSLFIQQYRENDQMFCHYQVAMGYYYYSRNLHRIAFYYFKRAEKKAQESENYGLLDIIYSQMIKLAREIGSVNPEAYIKKRKENRTILNRLSEVEDILEAFEYRMKISQNLVKSGPSISELLSQTLEEYTGNEDLKESPKVLFGTYYIISRTLLHQKDYEGMEQYLIKTYHEFQEKQLFNKPNHQQKLQMLAWIANAAFKNKRYSLSLEYAEKMLVEMERYDKLHYDPYEFYYYNILVINYSAINPRKAIEVLQQMADKENIEKHAFNGVFIYFNMALLYFQQHEYKKGIDSLNKLYRHWGFESMDSTTRLSAQIGELIMRYELKEYEFLEYRLKQVSKDNKAVLEDESMQREKDFIELLSEVAKSMGGIRSKKIRDKIFLFLENHKQQEDNESNLFGYYTWLSGKL